MKKQSVQQVDIFDLDDPGQKVKLNELLRSKNVYNIEHHVNFTPMGDCRIVMFYRIDDPEERQKPMKEKE